MPADQLCLAAAAAFFLTGLVTGAWKYACIVRDPDARAPVYVDVAHRSSLLYAFACGLIAMFVARSAYANTTNVVAASVLIAYFALSVLGYVIHGILRDTDNQLRRPHRLGHRTVPAGPILAFMLSLIAAEIGAFVVIVAGWLAGARAHV